MTVSRRRLVLSVAALLGVSDAARAALLRAGGPPKATPDVFDQVAPEAGIDTGVVFGDAIARLIAAGALVPDKLRALGGVPDWVERVFGGASTEPVLFSRDRAPYLVNLLWPLGLANRVGFNRRSPISAIRLPSFASTAGWTLGRAPNGYVYFNAVEAVPLTEQQAALALAIATKTFRPCCDNSTFFQDCNHGSALLGLIELAASQGATADTVYRAALTANSFWFPEQYARTAQYFSHFANRSWKTVSAQLVLGADFSTLAGWQRNVDASLRRAGITLPDTPAASPVCGINSG
jgi:hypothetical protein